LTYRTLAIKHPGRPVTLEKKTIDSLEDEVMIRIQYASINKIDAMLATRNIFNLDEPTSFMTRPVPRLLTIIRFKRSPVVENTFASALPSS